MEMQQIIGMLARMDANMKSNQAKLQATIDASHKEFMAA
jgi:hypothetical protein